MSEQRYIASNQKDEFERKRLALLEEVFDPFTLQRLGAVGVRAGWSCLEVGAGRGSVARWLSERVVPAGKVVATDINTRFIHRASIRNLEVRQHDIVHDDLERDQYNLVHCRTLLVHLHEPEKKALGRMVEAIRPGGWLLVEEIDYGSLLSTDLTIHLPLFSPRPSEPCVTQGEKGHCGLVFWPSSARSGRRAWLDECKSWGIDSRSARGRTARTI